MHGKALEANSTSESGWWALSATEKRPRAGAQVVLGDDVGRRAVLAGELDEVAAADLEAAGLVDTAAERVDGGERLGFLP